MPTVSIVLPTHNQAGYLHQTVESIRSQTMTDWELIIVDDASTDDTPTVVQELTMTDKRIRSIRNNFVEKTAGSLNNGFALATAELFTWTRDDNLYKPQALDVLVKMMPGNDFVYSGMTIIDDVGQVTGHVPATPPDQILLAHMLRGCFLYRRKIMDRVGSYDKNWYLVEDWDFWIRALRAGFKFKAIPDDLYEYRLHSGSEAEKQKQEIDEQVAKLMKHHNGSLPEPHHSACLLHLSRFAWEHGDKREGRKLARSAMHAPALKHYRGALMDGIFGPGTAKKWTRDQHQA